MSAGKCEGPRTEVRVRRKPVRLEQSGQEGKWTVIALERLQRQIMQSSEQVESQEVTVKIEPREIMAWRIVVTVKVVKISQILHVFGRQNDRIKKRFQYREVNNLNIKFVLMQNQAFQKMKQKH